MPLTLPNTIRNGIPVDGNNLEANFDAIEDFVNGEVVNVDGSVAMTAPLTLSGDPTNNNHAARKAYVDAQATAVMPTRRFTRTTNQAVNNTTYYVVFESQTGDTIPFTLASSTLTCTADGLYVITTEADWSNANGVGVDLTNASGGIIIFSSPDHTNDAAFRMSGGAAVYLRNGDQIRVLATSEGTVTLQEARLTIAQIASI